MSILTIIDTDKPTPSGIVMTDGSSSGKPAEIANLLQTETHNGAASAINFKLFNSVKRGAEQFQATIGTFAGQQVLTEESKFKIFGRAERTDKQKETTDNLKIFGLGATAEEIQPIFNLFADGCLEAVAVNLSIESSLRIQGEALDGVIFASLSDTQQDESLFGYIVLSHANSPKEEAVNFEVASLVRIA
jgi:hypothetical protein